MQPLCAMEERSRLRGVRILQSAATNRWDVDTAGRAVYYPFGPAFAGYRMADSIAEQNVRQADEHYSEHTSKISKPLGQFVGTLLVGSLFFILSRHPVLSLVGCYVLLAGAIYLDSILRSTSVRDTLANAEIVPAKAQSRKRLLVTIGAASGILFAFWAVLVAYNWQSSALEANHPGEIWLFPNIAGRLFLFVVLFLIIFSASVHFDRFSKKLGLHKATLTLVIVAVVDFGLGTWTLSNFVAPAPSIVVTDQVIQCGWRHGYRWRDITAVGSETNQHSRYVVLTLRPPITRMGKATDRCEIDGLMVDDDTVYRMIVAAWQPHANGS
jgi:hypothetical protein